MHSASDVHRFFPVEACLFDMDGTLIDSTPLVERIWRAWARRHGLDEELVASTCHGRQSRQTMETLAPHLNIAHEVAQMLKQELQADEGFGPIAGVHAFLRAIADEKWAIVTSAQGELARKRLQMCGITPPQVFVAAEDTPKSKPAPDGFLHAAKRLGADPARCLVFEDSLAGLAAGRAAGMLTLQIAATSPPVCAGSPLRVRDYDALSVTHEPQGLCIRAALLSP